tara:strand:- start:550 stop:861 length:312 start_codon:yes stop_codon:yes gene_type:complete
MFGKVLNFRFSTVSEAKIAASFCSENFGSKISEYDIIGLNIIIGQSGDLNVLFKFSNADSLKHFEENYKNIITDLKKSFTFKENNFVGVCAYSFEKEATVTVT